MKSKTREVRMSPGMANWSAIQPELVVECTGVGVVMTGCNQPFWVSWGGCLCTGPVRWWLCDFCGCQWAWSPLASQGLPPSSWIGCVVHDGSQQALLLSWQWWEHCWCGWLWWACQWLCGGCRQHGLMEGGWSCGWYSDSKNAFHNKP